MNPNPHRIPDPFRRRKVRRRLLPIDKARIESTGVLMWAPVHDALPTATNRAATETDPGSTASALPPSLQKLPPTALPRMAVEWPSWTIKQWRKVLRASPYLYSKPHYKERIADIKKRTKLILRNSSKVGGLKLACLVTGHIRFNRALLKLDLSSNALTHNAIAIVCSALERHQSCRDLNLSDNFVCADGAKAIGKLLQKTNSIRKIKLRNAHLTESGTRQSGIQSMAVGLRLNTSVEQLDLVSNALGLEGSTALLSTLTHNWRLEMLDLEDNHLADADALELCELINAAAAVMPDCRNRIKLDAFEVLKRPFSLGEGLATQPSILTSDTRWSRVKTISQETVETLIDAGIRLTQARVDRMRVQKELESQRFRLLRKEKPVYVPPPVSSAWDVLGRMRSELSSRVAEKMRTKGIRLPERYAAEDWYEQEQEKEQDREGVFGRLGKRAQRGAPAFLARVSPPPRACPRVLIALVCAFVCAAFPLLFAFTLVAALLAFVRVKFCGNADRRQRVDLLHGLPSSVEPAEKSWPEEKLDIVVFGATGLLGNYVLSYLTTHHPNLDIGVAGRSQSKLNDVRAAKGAPRQRVIVADAKDIKSILAMCAQTRVLLTTVGPFKRYGNLVYHACAVSGTHYVDITGETDWVSRMGAIYNSIAIQSGASLVSFAGVDSVPSDLGAFLVCKKFEKEHPGSSLQGVEGVVTRFKGGFPAGTIETVAGALDGTDRLQLPEGGRGALKSLNPLPRNANTKIHGLLYPLNRAAHLKFWTVPFFMANTNSRVVRLTNSIVGHTRDLCYTERMGFSSFAQALTYLLGAILIVPWVYLRPLRRVLRAIGILPKSNAGASAVSEKICEQGSLSFSFAAYGADKGKVSYLRFSAMGDPGVAHTAVCQSEIAVLLASRETTPRPGCVTPVAAVGAKRLKEALLGTGLVWIDEPPTFCCRGVPRKKMEAMRMCCVPRLVPLVCVLLLPTPTRCVTSAYSSTPGAYDDAARRSSFGQRTLVSNSVAQAAGAPGLAPTINPISGIMSAPDTIVSAPGSAGVAGAPLSNAVDFRTISNKNTDTVIALRNRFEIPDAAEMSARIYVPDDVVVAKVRLSVRGLYHEHAGDLKMTLLHQVDRVGMPPIAENLTTGPGGSAYGKARFNETASLQNAEAGSVVLVNGRMGPMTYGTPRSHPFPNEPGAAYPEPNLVRGSGYNYIFEDVQGANVALGKNATQSSTAYGAVAARGAFTLVVYCITFKIQRGLNKLQPLFHHLIPHSRAIGALAILPAPLTAVDGITNGFFSQNSVTHTAGHGLNNDPHPWWQVDLGAQQTIGTIRLWNRIQEPNVDEVQTITADASERMQGTFTVSFNFSGKVHTSAPIRHDAVASIADERNTTSSLGTGAAPGESMQAKLQQMANIGTVRVARSVFDAENGGHTWTITFVSEPGNLNELYAGDPSLPGLTAQGSTLRFRTLRDGNANVWYSYKYGMGAIRGRLYPAWLMVLPEDPSGNAWSNLTCLHVNPGTGLKAEKPCSKSGAETLAEAKSAAVWKVRVIEDLREADFRLPKGISGRYVRVQLESSEDYLSLSEVQVYAVRSEKIRDYTGGSPITPLTVYQPEESFEGTFSGMRARGPWLLSLADSKARTTILTSDNRPRYDAHGRGAIDDWVLVLTDTAGTVRTYHMDISATIKTLPIYGKLYEYDPTWKTRGRPIEFIKGMQRNNGDCLGSCDDNDNYGQGTDLSNTISGSIAAYNVAVKDRQIVYSPARDYLGEDSFSYTSWIGVTESKNTGVVTMDVRECRQDNCFNEAFGDTLGNLQELWYRDDGEPLTPIVPDAPSLLDTSTLVNEPWLHQPVPGVQNGPCGTAGVVCLGDTDQGTQNLPLTL
eukprot:g1368.t1